MIDYNQLTQRAYDCAIRRGKITEDTTVSEILCDCMVELLKTE